MTLPRCVKPMKVIRHNGSAVWLLAAVLCVGSCVSSSPVQSRAPASRATATFGLGTTQPSPSAIRSPLPPDPLFTRLAAGLCFTDEVPPAGTAPLLQDRREQNAALVLFVPASGALACLLERGEGNNVAVVAELSEQAEIHGPQVVATAWLSLEPGGMLIGRVEDGIRSVQIELDNAAVLDASLADRFFAVWWTDDAIPRSARGFDVTGRPVDSEDLSYMTSTPNRLRSGTT